MNTIKKMLSIVAMIGLAIASTVSAGTNVTDNITGSVTWTKANSPYHLKKQIYVVPGATLTMEKGTVVASFKPDQGSICVTRGAKIYIKGERNEPVIMTSAEDVATWEGTTGVVRDGNSAADPNIYPGGYVTSIGTMGAPQTGTWRPICNEWGSLCILGEGLISASHYSNSAVTYQDGAGSPIHTNTKCPDGLNKKVMEGLVAKFTGDPNVLYGGNNDDDDSGCIRYLSLRYGGKVIGLNNELNGMSLGAVGRGTDISYVEIMNNVDDGIEIWGGTVDLDHLTIWNIGDDSLDIDEGYRGCIEYGLIVQGYCANASQGSGVGDNCFETDGAEDCDAQPMTTTRIKYFTCIGQPDGDYGTTWRDNARVQYSHCVWMDLGDDLVGFDNSDTDGADGYNGLDSRPPFSTDPNDSIRLYADDGTLSWKGHWTTDMATWIASGNFDPRGCGIDPNLYLKYLCCCSETPAKLCQITNSVFHNNKKYTEAEIVGVVDINAVVDGYNPAQALTNVITSVDPVQKIVRGPQITPGGKKVEPVLLLNPISTAEAFDMSAGGFACSDNWVVGWTAADAYGMIDRSNSDLNCDDTVDFFDFGEFANDWLSF